MKFGLKTLIILSGMALGSGFLAESAFSKASAPFMPTWSQKHQLQRLVDEAGLALPMTHWPLPAEVVRLGAFPDTLDGLLALSGVGQYTARAVLAFSFESSAAVVDTNIARVLARLAGERLTARRAQALADELCPASESWMWNQAIMDLGAALCRPAPKCADCPVRSYCTWVLAGSPDPDPAVGSAGVSGRQARFEGSDRQARGRLMTRLVGGAVAEPDAAAVMQVGAERAARIVEALIDERLVVRSVEPNPSTRTLRLH